MRNRGDWYPQAWRVVLMLYVVVCVWYYLIATDAARVSRTWISFERQYDKTLYKIDDQLAYNVIANENPEFDWFAVVLYRRDYSPLGWVCGSCVTDGSLINNAAYRKGDLVYTDTPHHIGADVANLVTGETFQVDAPEPPLGQTIDPAQLALYRDLGLTFEPQYRLSSQALRTSLEQLPARAESCVIFQVAFWLVFAVLLLLGIPRLIRLVR